MPIKIIIAKTYKYEMLKRLKKLVDAKVEFKEIFKTMMKEYGRFDKNLNKQLPKLIKNIQGKLKNAQSEKEMIEKIKPILEQEFRTNIVVELGDNSQETKANSAIPDKPAILLK